MIPYRTGTPKGFSSTFQPPGSNPRAVVVIPTTKGPSSYQMKTLVFAFVVSMIAPAIVKAAQKPNLVFMILDDQDSMLGSGLDVMPNYVARFIKGGATASNAFVASPKVGGL